MNATALLTELADLGITAHADGDRIRLDGPRGALNESVLSAVRDSKAELLELLTEMVGGTSYADREWDRFFACAVPTPSGLGLHDPSEPPDLPTGVPGAAWDAFVRDCGNLGGSKALSLDGDQVRQAVAGDHESPARFAERFLYQAARCVAGENAALGVTQSAWRD